MGRKNPLKFLAFLPVALSAVALTAYAASTTPPPAPVTTVQGLVNILCELAVWFFYIVIVITVIMIIYAAFLYVTAGDNTEKTSKARRTITYAAVGVIVALCAVGFPSIVGGVVGSTSTGSLLPHCSLLGGSDS